MTCVKETLCTSCVHREVCSKKEEFQAAQDAVDHVTVNVADNSYINLSHMTWIHPVQLQCNHFMLQHVYRKLDDVTGSTAQRSVLDGVITEVRG